MIFFNLEIIDIELLNKGYFFKAIVNTNSIAFFSGKIQHRNLKVGNLSYEDDYLGNAMACIIKPDRIEVRYQSDFTDSQVAEIFRNLRRYSEFIRLKDHPVSYQGRPISFF